MTHAELQAEYVALTREVEKRALRIFGLAGTAGRADEAAEKAAELAELVATRREQFAMRHEQGATDRYDLASLAVTPDTLTNSETAYERD